MNTIYSETKNYFFGCLTSALSNEWLQQLNEKYNLSSLSNKEDHYVELEQDGKTIPMFIARTYNNSTDIVIADRFTCERFIATENEDEELETVYSNIQLNSDWTILIATEHLPQSISELDKIGICFKSLMDHKTPIFLSVETQEDFHSIRVEELQYGEENCSTILFETYNDEYID